MQNVPIMPGTKLFSVGLAVVALTATFLLFPFPVSAAPGVTWTPKKVSQTVPAGDTITVPTTPAIVAGDHLWLEFAAAAGTLIAFNASVNFQ